MRLALTALLATLATAPLAAQRTRSIVVVPGQLTTVVTDTMGTAYDVPFAPARTFAAVQKVFADLKIPVDIQDSAQGRVESKIFYRQGDFAGKQISTFLSCGDGMTGPYADSYRVYMVTIVKVAPEGDHGSTIRTIFLAGAVAVAEGAHQPVSCESTGRLELRMQKLVTQKAAGL